MSTEQQTINILLTRAKKAQQLINSYTQQQINELVLAIAWAIINPTTNARLANIAVETTGLGSVADKIIKNQRKTIGLLRDLKNVKTVGVISRNKDKGIIEIARPVGVIGAIVPSTNPIATPLNKIINAVKCRNAIIVAPSPKGNQVCEEIIKLIHNTIKKMGAPTALVQKLPSPISKELTNELTKQVDLVIATGSQNNILRAQQHGTPTLGVGVGNVVAIIDDSADIDDATTKIIASKTFDYATSCSSENSLVIVDKIYDKVIQQLNNKNCVMLDNKQKQQLQKVMWDKNMVINRDIVAKSTQKIAQNANLDGNFDDTKIIMVQERNFGKNYPFSGEKLSPILTIYRAKNFADAAFIAENILDYQGKGHSCSIHSTNDNNIMYLAEKLKVCRIIVNQAHCFATGGNFDNGMPFSLSMGCGTWGNNIIDTNIHYKQYLNITKIVKTIAVDEPSEQQIFGDYWKKYGK